MAVCNFISSFFYDITVVDDSETVSESKQEDVPTPNSSLPVGLGLSDLEEVVVVKNSETAVIKQEDVPTPNSSLPVVDLEEVVISRPKKVKFDLPANYDWIKENAKPWTASGSKCVKYPLRPKYREIFTREEERYEAMRAMCLPTKNAEKSCPHRETMAMAHLRDSRRFTRSGFPQQTMMPAIQESDDYEMDDLVMWIHEEDECTHL